jgi:hypothetical protein
MKPIKIFALALGAVGLVLALVAILALTPAVQTWAVRRAVASQPGMTIELGRVAAGLSTAEITDLRVVKDRAVVTAKLVSVQYSAWDYLAKKRINADFVRVQDLVVDLRAAGNLVGDLRPAGNPAAVPGGPTSATGAGRANAGPPAAKGSAVPPTASAKPVSPIPPAVAAKPVPFDGILKLVQLPLDLRVAKFAANGRALLPQDQVVTFDLKAANLETGQKGKLEWIVDFADPQKNAPLQGLKTTGSLALHLTPDRRIDLIEVDATANAVGPGLPKDRLKLEAKVEQPTASGNESYAVRVGLVRQDKMEQLLGGTAQYQPATKEIAGGWEVAIRSEQLAALLAGLGLPELAASGSGKFTVNPTRNAMSASGEIQGQVSQLAKLSPALATVGDVRFVTKFDSGLADNVARLDRLEVEITGADGRKFAQLNLLQKVAYALDAKRVTLANPKSELARLSLQALPLAWAQSAVKPLVIESGDVSLALAIEAEADGSRVRVRTLEPLTLRTVTIKDGALALVDRVSLNTRLTIDYSANRVAAEITELSITMPAGDELTGKFTADVTSLSTNPTAVFSTQLQAKVVNALKPFLPFEPGPVAVAFAAEGQADGQRVQLRKASVGVNRAAGALLAALEIQQPVSADFKQNTVSVANPAANAARVRLGELPLAWAEPFVPKSKFAGAITGGTFDLVMRSQDDLSVNTTAPITIRGVSAELDGKALAQALDAAIDFTATKRGDAIGYELRRFEVKQGETSLATATVTGEAKLGAKIRVSVKGNLEADAAALMKQPALAPFATLVRGKVTTVFEATIGETVQAKAAIAGRTLVARQSNQPLGDLDLSVVVNVKADGSGTVTLPLTLTLAGRKSDLAIDGTFGRSAKAFLFTGKIASNQLITDDLQLLGALAPSSTPASTPATPTPGSRVAARDEQPFWAGVNGKLELDLKKVVYGRDYVIGGVRGSAVVTDTRLALESLEGKFKDNPFKLNAGVTFTARQPQPYALTGNANVSNLDIGEILRAANPKENPALETKVTVAAKLNGQGPNLPGLIENIYGQFDLTGSKGVLRALGRKGQAVGALSSIVGLIGAARGSNTTVAASELAAELNEMRFDKFTLHVDRSADLNLKLTALEFVSASTRVTGTGSITSQPKVPIGNQPLRVQMKIAGKQHMATILNKAGLLDGQQDDQGFYTMNTAFEVSGTPANPNSNDLWRIIGEAAARALLR